MTMGRRKVTQQWDQSDIEEDDERKDTRGMSSTLEEEELNIKNQDENQEEEAKFAQYMDSDEDLDSDGEGSSDYEEDVISSKDVRTQNQDEESSLRKKMERIPFSALARAKRMMGKGADISDEDDEDHPSSEIDEFEVDRKTEREKQEKRAMQLIEKRESKHA